jgi:hypothetical protein
MDDQQTVGFDPSLYPPALCPPAPPNDASTKVLTSYPTVLALAPVENGVDYKADGVISGECQVEAIHNPDGLDLRAPAWNGKPYLNARGVPVVDTFEHTLPDPKCDCCTNKADDDKASEKLSLIWDLVEADQSIPVECRLFAFRLLKHKEFPCQFTCCFTIAWICCYPITILLIILAVVKDWPMLLAYVLPYPLAGAIAGPVLAGIACCDRQCCKCSYHGFLEYEQWLNRMHPDRP